MYERQVINCCNYMFSRVCLNIWKWDIQDSDYQQRKESSSQDRLLMRGDQVFYFNFFMSMLVRSFFSGDEQNVKQQIKKLFTMMKLFLNHHCTLNATFMGT